MKLLLVRHCETIANQKKLWEGEGNSDLNETGIKQAKKLGELLKDYEIHTTYCSPKSRCIQTANWLKNINSSIKDIKIVDNLVETDFGDWEGKDFKTIQQEFPKEAEKFIKNHNNFKFPNGESYKQFFKRCKSCISYIIKKTDKESTVLIVSHAGVIRCIISYLIGLSYEGFYCVNPQQGAYSSLNIYDNFVELEYVNYY